MSPEAGRSFVPPGSGRPLRLRSFPPPPPLLPLQLLHLLDPFHLLHPLSSTAAS